MTRIGLIVVLLATLGLAGLRSVPEQPATDAPQTSGTFAIDPVHSAIVFRIKHFGVSMVYGRFNDFEGQFTLGDGGSINVAVDVATIDTKNEQRNNHLKSPDFFSVKQYPTITFTSTSMKATGEDIYEVTGEMTLLGQTRPVTCTITKIGEKDGGPRIGHRAGITCELHIKRSDYGMTWGVDNGALGDEVTLLIAFEGVKQ